MYSTLGMTHSVYVDGPGSCGGLNPMVWARDWVARSGPFRRLWPHTMIFTSELKGILLNLDVDEEEEGYIWVLRIHIAWLLKNFRHDAGRMGLDHVMVLQLHTN